MRLFHFAFLLLLLPAGCRPLIALGRNPSEEDAKKFVGLSNYADGEFRNIERATVNPTLTVPGRGPRWLRLLKYFGSRPENTRPDAPLPSVVTDLRTLDSSTPTVVWFGHSSFLLKTANATLLFDPAFSDFAGPFRGLIPAFSGTTHYNVKDLPPVDALVISHDHYDHLDYNTVRKLRKKVKRVVVPLGVGSHFRRWGYKPEQITELNWNESVMLGGGVKVWATPAHHRSNRTMAQRKTLWASYVIEADGRKLYFSGDTGYSKHFKLIGDAYGPFDLAMMECGQYNTKWPQSHMQPPQTAQAAVDLRAAMVLPIHWAKFAESEHRWNEPVERLLASADSSNLQVTVPLIGQPYRVGQPALKTAWWRF